LKTVRPATAQRREVPKDAVAGNFFGRQLNQLVENSAPKATANMPGFHSCPTAQVLYAQRLCLAFILTRGSRSSAERLRNTSVGKSADQVDGVGHGGKKMPATTDSPASFFRPSSVSAPPGWLVQVFQDQVLSRNHRHLSRQNSNGTNLSS
jgi:hypothetical protein